VSKISVNIDGHNFTVDVKLDRRTGSRLQVEVNGETIPVVVPDLDSELDRMEWMIVGDRPYEIVLDPDLHWIKAWAGLHRLEVRDVEARASRAISGDARVKAPIPGQVTRILVTQGEAVTVGQPLLVLEAMKMENEIRAPRAGTVSHLNVRPGQDVTLNYLLAEIS
jgi:acetyl/propionyl-CoA carboxylase alpha subunit